MKKILVAVILAALIAALIVMPVAAEGDITEAATEYTTEAATEEVTEEETNRVDGAILQEDYLYRMMAGAKTWLFENPETVGSVICSGIMLVAAFVMSGTTKKERKEGKKREEGYAERSTVMNNNAVEMVETAKNIVTEGKTGIVGAVTDVLAGFRELANNIVTELRANRMETRANSVLMVELLKNARLPEKRKDEIIALYNKERSGEEVEADDAADEA